MMSLIFDGILLLPMQSINIKDIENYLYNKSNIPMKISIKLFFIKIQLAILTM